MTPSSSPPHDQGLFAERYRLLKVLGSGGFAKVYHAVQVDTGREVALKIIAPHQVQEKRQSNEARFLREVKALAALREPTTLTLYDHGITEDGELYLVSEWIRGQSVADHLEQIGPMAARHVAELARAVLRSLEEAHRLGIAHRDLKPTNIMRWIDARGEVHYTLIDFGIAKFHHAASSPTLDLTGEQIVGTPRYMAPELLRGERDFCPQSDLYGLGLILHEALRGEHPIRSELPMSIFAEQLDERSYALPDTLPIPAGLRAIIDCASQKRLAARYASATQMLEEIEQWLKQSPEREPTAPLDAPSFRLDWRPVATLAVAALALLAGAALLVERAARGADHAERARPLEPSAPNLAPAAPSPAAALEAPRSRRAETHEFDSELEQNPETGRALKPDAAQDLDEAPAPDKALQPEPEVVKKPRKRRAPRRRERDKERAPTAPAPVTLPPLHKL